MNKLNVCNILDCFFLCLLPTYYAIQSDCHVTTAFQFKVQGLGWPLPNLNFVCLEPRCCSLTGVFRVGVLLKHPFHWHFLFSIRQHDLFKYSDRSKLILYPWYAINRPDSILRRNSLISWCFHHHASRSSQCTVAWIQCLVVVWQTVCGPRTQKEQSYLHQSTNCFSISL